MEERLGISQTLSPAINDVLRLLVHIAVGLYSQEHLNKVWEAARQRTDSPRPGELPPPP